MNYDGTASLAPAVALLIGCSPKNHVKIAKVLKDAKQALAIGSKSKRLEPEIKLTIYNYLVEQYPQSNNMPVKTNSQDVKIKPQPNDINPVEIISQSEVINSQPITIKQSLEVTLENNVITDVIVKNSSVKTNSQDSNLYSQVDNFDNIRIAFYIAVNGERKRQIISLDGFLINALATIGILKSDVTQWVQIQIDEWTAFDSKLPITRQVKYMIMREVVKGLSGNDGVFYPCPTNH